MFMPRALLLTGMAASLVATGCTVPQTPDGADADVATSSAAAIVVVERTVGPGDALRDDSIVARFVRARQGAVDDATLRLAGVAHDAPPVGQCALASAAETAAPAQPREVDLLDVGPLRVVGGRATELRPRAMPDPTGIVSGVVYSARAAEAFGAGSPLQIRASGGRDLVDGFVVTVGAPRDVETVQAVLTSAGTVDVAWDPPELRDGDARDLVYVELLDHGAHVALRCTTVDGGQATVPASFVRALGNLDDALVAVHFLHSEPFQARGLDAGEVRFDTTRVVTLSRP